MRGTSARFGKTSVCPHRPAGGARHPVPLAPHGTLTNAAVPGTVACKLEIERLDEEKKLNTSKYHSHWARLTMSLAKLVNTHGEVEAAGDELSHNHLIRIWQGAVAVDNSIEAHDELSALMRHAGFPEEATVHEEEAVAGRKAMRHARRLRLEANQAYTRELKRVTAARMPRKAEL